MGSFRAHRRDRPAGPRPQDGSNNVRTRGGAALDRLTGPIAQVVYAEGAAGAGQTLYLHREALGSVGLVTDNQGDEVERTYFDPFGEKTDALGEVGSPLLGAVKLGFTGHRHDDELGLIDAKGRVYDSAQKRFLTPDIYLPDPLSSQSYNRYSYVANNPLRYTDPTGFMPSPADHKAKGSAQPDGGTAAPAPAPPVLLGPIAPVTLIRAKADDTGNTPPEPPAVSRAEQEGKWAELMKHMAWGAARQLFNSAPPVVAVRNIQHNIQLAASAVRSAREGDWGQAFSTLLEMPEKTALGAARVLTGPIDAALSIPASVQAAMNPEVDPEMRGAAMVQGAQAVIAVVATVAAAVKTYQTYTKTNVTTGEVYSGRTSGTGSPRENVAHRDAGHHMTEKGFGPAELVKSSTNEAAIRGHEQLLIEHHGGAKRSGGTSGNEINAISERNPRRQYYLDQARKEFGK